MKTNLNELELIKTKGLWNSEKLRYEYNGRYLTLESDELVVRNTSEDESDLDKVESILKLYKMNKYDIIELSKSLTVLVNEILDYKSIPSSISLMLKYSFAFNYEPNGRNSYNLILLTTDDFAILGNYLNSKNYKTKVLFFTRNYNIKNKLVYSECYYNRLNNAYNIIRNDLSVLLELDENKLPTANRTSFTRFYLKTQPNRVFIGDICLVTDKFNI